MSKPKFSQKRRGKKVDPYPLNERKAGESKKTSRPSKGRPRKPKTQGGKVKIQIPGREPQWVHFPEGVDVSTAAGQAKALNHLVKEVEVEDAKVRYRESLNAYWKTKLEPRTLDFPAYITPLDEDGDTWGAVSYAEIGYIEPSPDGSRVLVPARIFHESERYASPPYGVMGQDYDHASDQAWDELGPKIAKEAKRRYPTKKGFKKVLPKGWKLVRVERETRLSDKHYYTSVTLVCQAPRRTTKKRLRSTLVEMAELRQNTKAIVQNWQV